MRTPLAWLNLVHERSRLLVAIAGVAFAVMIIFLNLGFLGALSLTASQVYSQLNAEIFLSSPQTLEISSPKPFPIERIYQAAGVAGVERTMPMYMGYDQWRNPETRINRAIFVYAINPNDPVFLLPALQDPATIAALRRPNTVLMDVKSRPEFGPQAIGVETEAGRRNVTIGGQFSLGGGFAADGTLIMSDQNFRRYLNPRPLNLIDLGLIKLDGTVATASVQAQLRQILPKDVEVLTKAEITERDRAFWIGTTSTGFIFGMGVAVSCIVGAVIVYQILYTDISDHMRQFATLKAMGYRNGFLCKLVIEESIILAILGYIPGFGISLGLYDLALRATSGTLPLQMTLERAGLVMGLTLGMCLVSGLISIQRMVQANPADVF